MTSFSLGVLDFDNDRLEVVITAVPERGTLYHATDLVPILDVGTVVNNVKGVVQFFAAPDEFGKGEYGARCTRASPSWHCTCGRMCDACSRRLAETALS